MVEPAHKYANYRHAVEEIRPPFVLTGLATDILYIGLATVLIWLACGWLESASHNLARAYALPEIVKGSIVMAVSSSFPELVTVVLAGSLHGDFELGLATIIGSAIFNVLVIPGISVLYRAGALETDRHHVYRETQFYLVSVLIVMVTLSLAVIYYPHAQSRGTGTLTRSLALLPLIFYFLYLYIQYHEVHEHRADEPAPRIRPGREWMRLLVSMLVVTVGVELLIRAAIDLGRTLDTPSYFWGATILAAATSVPDLFMSMRAAGRSNGVSSLSNALGSNIFDLLVVIPVGVLTVGAVAVNYIHLTPMMVFLIIATVSMLILARRDFVLSNANGAALLMLYAAFVVWMGLDGFGVI